MEKEDVINYIRMHTEVEVPSLQKRFSLSYAESKEIVDELTADGTIEFMSGVSYKVNSDSREPQTYIPKNSTEEMYIKALWECVKSGSVSISNIQRNCSIGFATAMHAVDWMENNGFITPLPLRSVAMSKEDFIKKFGNIDEKEAQDDNAVIERLIELRKLAEEGKKEQSNKHVGDIDDDDDDYESIFKDDDDDEDGYFDNEDDIDMCGYDDDDDDDDERVDWRTVLVRSFDSGLVPTSGEDKYILGLDGRLDLELKFINNHGELRISDGGKTVGSSNQTKRRIANVLKAFAPVKLENNEIVIVIDNPLGTLSALLRLYAAMQAVKNMK